MGLDQYLIKITRISKEEADALSGLDLDEIRDRGYSCLECEVGRNLISYTRTIKVTVHRPNYRKIAREFGLPEEAEIFIVGYTFKDNRSIVNFDWVMANDTHGYFSVDRNRLLSELSDEELEEIPVFRTEILERWRNDDAVNEYFDEHLTGGTGIMNCTHYSVPLDIAGAYISREDLDSIASDDDSTLCYYIWY